MSSEGKEDDQPSCSTAEALTRQEPFINQNLAYQALAMMTQCFDEAAWHTKAGFNLATGQLVPLPIHAGSLGNRPCSMVKLSDRSAELMKIAFYKARKLYFLHYLDLARVRMFAGQIS